METIKSRTPPATIKLEIVIPKIANISEPATANRISKAADVNIAILDTDFLSFFPILSVIARNNGTLPTGSITTKRAIVDLRRLGTKVAGIVIGECASDGANDNKNEYRENVRVVCSKPIRVTRNIIQLFYSIM
jgi:hypothetical protein